MVGSPTYPKPSYDPNDSDRSGTILDQPEGSNKELSDDLNKPNPTSDEFTPKPKKPIIHIVKIGKNMIAISVKITLKLFAISFLTWAIKVNMKRSTIIGK
jgi:hypothetical protein